jgi:hypothetical protein
VKRRALLFGILCLLLAAIPAGSVALVPDRAPRATPTPPAAPPGFRIPANLDSLDERIPLPQSGAAPLDVGDPPAPPGDLPPVPPSVAPPVGPDYGSNAVERTADDKPKVDGDAAPPAQAVGPLAAPANDDFNNALLIASTPYLSEIDTSEATTAGDDPYVPCGSTGVPRQSNTVWYRYVAPRNDWLRIDTYGAGIPYDTIVAVWTGNRGSLSYVGGNDDYYYDGTSRADIPVVAGTTYHIEVADWGNPGGGALRFAVRTGEPLGWSRRADLPTARDRLAVTSDGTYVYAIGGEEFAANFQPSQSAQRYDPTSNSWLNRANMPVAYSNIDAAYLDGEIYVPAGYAGTQPYAGTHRVYDVAANLWGTAAPAPWASTTTTPTIWYALAEDPVSNAYYLSGGYDGQNSTDVLLRYDADSDAWAILAPMHTARHGHGAAFIKGKLYVAGGDTASAEVYDPDTNSWSYVASMSTGRKYPASSSSLVCYETYGYWSYAWIGDARDRGNIYHASYPAILQEIYFGLIPMAPTSMYFFVYESEPGLSNPLGTYTKIHETYISSTGSQIGWLGSGPIEVLLSADRYYYIGASWAGDAIYGRSDQLVPMAISCMGSLQSGQAWDRAGYPPAGSVMIESDHVYYSPYLMHLDFSGGYGPWYVAGGGYTGANLFLDTTEVYDPATNAWTLLEERLYYLHQPRRWVGAALTDAGEFYVVGGQDNNCCASGGCLSALNERLVDVQSVFAPATLRNYCAEADPYEPNDSFDDAYPIQSGLTYGGNFGCTGDINDVFSFAMGAAHTVEVWLTDIPSGNDFSLCLYDGNRQQLICSQNPGSANEHISAGTRPAGTYYVQVYNQGGTYNAGVTYRLRAVFQ